MALFYFIATLKSIFKVTNDVRKLIDHIESAIDLVKDKINSSTSYGMLIGDTLKKILDMAKKINVDIPFGKKKKRKDPEDYYEDEDLEI